MEVIKTGSLKTAAVRAQKGSGICGQGVVLSQFPILGIFLTFPWIIYLKEGEKILYIEIIVSIDAEKKLDEI